MMTRIESQTRHGQITSNSGEPAADLMGSLLLDDLPVPPAGRLAVAVGVSEPTFSPPRDGTHQFKSSVAVWKPKILYGISVPCASIASVRSQLVWLVQD